VLDHPETEQVLLAHGDGGALSRELIAGLFQSHFRRDELRGFPDAALLPATRFPERLAMTTDAFVVSPLIFAGGDIGCLSIWGTVNDLAVSGADPLWISAAFILEEGLELSLLDRVVASMAGACAEAGVDVVAGDTKVVERGKVDGMYVTTTGIGRVWPWVDARRHLGVREGDRLVVSGTLGEHGAAVLGARFGFGGDGGSLRSDCASLRSLSALLWRKCPRTRLMRDLTRGGLAAASEEVALAAKVDIWLDESCIPVREEVAALSELLGVDPFYLASEGRLAAVVPADDAELLLSTARSHPMGRGAEQIGEVRRGNGRVFLRTIIGGTRLLGPVSGAPLPRIC